VDLIWLPACGLVVGVGLLIVGLRLVDRHQSDVAEAIASTGFVCLGALTVAGSLFGFGACVMRSIQTA
jgi:hypothetical protein